MHIESPHYQFDPTSPGWIKRKVRNGQYVSKADMLRVLSVHPECHDDPVISNLMCKALLGQLPAVRGRKRTVAQQLIEMYAVELHKDLAPRLVARVARRRAKGIRKRRGDFSATELCFALIAKRIGMKEWESVRNLVSSRK